MLENLDYGREKFVKCSVGDEVIYVKTDREYSGDIKLTPDMDAVKVIEKSRQLRIV